MISLRVVLKICCIAQCMLLVACASTGNKSKGHSLELQDLVDKKLYNYELGNGSEVKPESSGYFVHLKKENGSWVAVSIQETRPFISMDEFKFSEVLYVSKDFSFIQPDFRTFEFLSHDNTYNCIGGLGGNEARYNRAEYNPCDSQFTKPTKHVQNLVKNAGTHAMTMGIGLLVGAHSYYVKIDPEAIEKIAKEALVQDNLLGFKFKSERDKKIRELAEYRNFLSQKRSIQALEGFISKYRDNDPDMLIPEAERKLSIARKVQAEKEKRLREKEALIAKKKREKKQRRIAKMTQEFDQFRKNIKQGDDSHCGLVVKVDGAVVLVQSMIGPHWLKLDEIYPANRARCGFSNGVYVHNDPRWY